MRFYSEVFTFCRLSSHTSLTIFVAFIATVAAFVGHFLISVVTKCSKKEAAKQNVAIPHIENSVNLVTPDCRLSVELSF